MRGFSAHGLGTERARLAGELRYARGFRKKCLLPMEILVFFLSKIPPILNLELDFFPLKHVFEIFWPNTVNYRSINYL